VTEQVSARGVSEVFEMNLPNVLLRREGRTAKHEGQHKHKAGHRSSLASYPAFRENYRQSRSKSRSASKSLRFPGTTSRYLSEMRTIWQMSRGRLLVPIVRTNRNFQLGRHFGYSHRNASMGSTAEARRAGSKQANPQATSNRSDAMRRTSG
jgi:hypothetical protein